MARSRGASHQTAPAKPESPFVAANVTRVTPPGGVSASPRPPPLTCAALQLRLSPPVFLTAFPPHLFFFLLLSGHVSLIMSIELPLKSHILYGLVEGPHSADWRVLFTSFRFLSQRYSSCLSAFAKTKNIYIYMNYFPSLCHLVRLLLNLFPVRWRSQAEIDQRPVIWTEMENCFCPPPHPPR